MFLFRMFLRKEKHVFFQLNMFLRKQTNVLFNLSNNIFLMFLLAKTNVFKNKNIQKQMFCLILATTISTKTSNRIVVFSKQQ